MVRFVYDLVAHNNHAPSSTNQNQLPITIFALVAVLKVYSAADWSEAVQLQEKLHLCSIWSLLPSDLA